VLQNYLPAKRLCGKPGEPGIFSGRQSMRLLAERAGPDPTGKARHRHSGPERSRTHLAVGARTRGNYPWNVRPFRQEGVFLSRLPAKERRTGMMAFSESLGGKESRMRILPYPGGKLFAFTIVDDTDGQTLESV